MKKQLNVRISESGHNRLAWLTTKFGTQTTAVEIALDRLYNQERSKLTEYTLDQLSQFAIADLDDWLKGNPEELERNEPHDVIHEIADSSVPVYHADLLRVASENWELMTDEPEVGPAFDGSPTPINIIAANLYEHIRVALWGQWEAEREAWEEAERLSP